MEVTKGGKQGGCGWTKVGYENVDYYYEAWSAASSLILRFGVERKKEYQKKSGLGCQCFVETTTRL